jgi:hypothetical protein
MGNLNYQNNRGRGCQPARRWFIENCPEGLEDSLRRVEEGAPHAASTRRRKNASLLVMAGLAAVGGERVVWTWSGGTMGAGVVDGGMVR